MSTPLFDKSSEYDAMLAEGLKLSGESKDYFMRGRVDDLIAHLPADFRPKRILDYGCGLGETSLYFSQLFPQARVVGVDTALSALEHAKINCQNKNVLFMPAEQLDREGPYDLCYTNGVFHHIEPKHRLEAAKHIYQSLAPGGIFALFENNPWNPGTLLVMSRIAFDRGVKKLTCKQTEALLRAAGFECSQTRFLFYFPRALKMLRALEPLAARIPLGAQYYMQGRKR